jgi:hypothetical protein
LGIPRRRFLKRTAAAAFVAPLVVSFGLDGISEASTVHIANSCYPNSSYSNQGYYADQQLVNLIRQVFYDFEDGLSYRAASNISSLALTAALEVADDRPTACSAIQQLINAIEAEAGSEYSAELLYYAQEASNSVGCYCTVSDLARTDRRT